MTLPEGDGTPGQAHGIFLFADASYEYAVILRIFPAECGRGRGAVIPRHRDDVVLQRIAVDGDVPDRVPRILGRQDGPEGLPEPFHLIFPPRVVSQFGRESDVQFLARLEMPEHLESAGHSGAFLHQDGHRIAGFSEQFSAVLGAKAQRQGQGQKHSPEKAFHIHGSDLDLTSSSSF